ncbi:MAG: SGNH/GDSL hydrolase family protein [Alphaproteobacteria bacterium]
MKTIFKGSALIGALALGLLAPTLLKAMTFDSIVVFGGSVSDSGNFFALFGIANEPPYDELDMLLVPTGPYAVGGHHSSNGPTWIEQFANGEMNRYVQPAFRSANPHAANYAVAGARSTDVPLTIDMPQQIDQFLKDRGGVAPGDALYVIDFGGNDVRDALTVALMGGNPDPIIQAAGLSIFSNIMRLYNAGARKFLILNVADIGEIPSIRILDNLYQAGGTIMQGATDLSEGLNDWVGFLLTLLPANVEIAKLDVLGTVRELVAHPSAHGLLNVTDACITPNVPPFRCENPDQFLFWDGIHPTKVVQAIFAQEAADALGQ